MVVVPRRHAGAPVDLRPRIETIASPVAKRSLSASAGDRVRISVLPMQEVRIYRGEQRLLRCAADVAPQPGCVRDDGGLVAELELERPGEYKLLIVLDGAAPLEDTFDRDVAALRTAGSAYQVQPFPVR
ncbi:MAG TPA: hypothetical protein VN253_14565, partial [Kofleriaceae bacterium]|nr:hypothetical protein [Kofleriaceae bacterium]